MRFYKCLSAAVVSVCAYALVSSAAQAAAPCDEFAARLPNMKRAFCESANLQPSPVKSVKG